MKPSADLDRILDDVETVLAEAAGAPDQRRRQLCNVAYMTLSVVKRKADRVPVKRRCYALGQDLRRLFWLAEAQVLVEEEAPADTRFNELRNIALNSVTTNN
jgi:hypothetical protein